MIEINNTESQPLNNDFKETTGIIEPPAKFESTPEKQNTTDSESNSQASPVSPDAASPSGTATGEKRKTRYKGKGLDANGRPRNFYNPPGKVLRSLANQSYYDSFYGNAGQVYTLKQKYKTQLCKHFIEHGECPLHQFCQFAHGGAELRQANDPLPANFGKTALGAVHSNYKTEPCRYMQKEGKCPFGEGCSFFHDNSEKRSLIDPLPNLPEGVTLPPMPEKIRNNNKAKYNSYNKNHYNNYSPDQNMGNSASISPFHFNPLNNQPPSLIQITSFAEMAAFGGFNPNKYLSPAPVAMQSQINGMGFNGQPAPVMITQPQVQVQPVYYPQQMGMQGQNQNQGQDQQSPGKNYNGKGYNGQKNKNQHRYEKKENSAGKNKKGDKNQGEQKKYAAKKPQSAKKQEKEQAEAPAEEPAKEATKTIDIAASQ